MKFNELPQEVQDEFIAHAGPNKEFISIMGNEWGTGYTLSYWDHFDTNRGPQKVGKRINILDPTGKTQRSESSKRYVESILGPNYPTLQG